MTRPGSTGAGNFHSDALHVVDTLTIPHAALMTPSPTKSPSRTPKVFSRPPGRMSMPVYRRLEKNAQLLEFKCVEFAKSSCMGIFRKQAKQVRKEVEMSHRFIASNGCSGGHDRGRVCLAPVPIVGQAKSSTANTTSAAKSWTEPRTAEWPAGPAGNMSNATLTPLERPRELRGSSFLRKRKRLNMKSKYCSTIMRIDATTQYRRDVRPRL